MTDIQALDAKVSGSDAFGLTNYDKLKSNFDLLLNVLRGWLTISGACAYVSADGHTYVMSIVGDYTGLIGIGDWIAVTQSAVIRYFRVSAAPTLGGGNTTVTMYGGTDQVLANSAITSPQFSHSKTPFGVNPAPAKWTEETNDSSNRAQLSPVTNTVYNVGSLNLVIPIGPFDVSYDGNFFSSDCSHCDTALSTTNNGLTDADLVAEGGGTGTGTYTAPLGRRKPLVLTVKTTYYLNMRARSSATNINWIASDSGGNTIIRARFSA